MTRAEYLANYQRDAGRVAKRKAKRAAVSDEQKLEESRLRTAKERRKKPQTPVVAASHGLRTNVSDSATDIEEGLYYVFYKAAWVLGRVTRSKMVTVTLDAGAIRAAAHSVVICNPGEGVGDSHITTFGRFLSRLTEEEQAASANQ